MKKISLIVLLLCTPVYADVSINWTSRAVTVTVFNDHKIDLLCAGPVYIRDEKYLYIEDISRIVKAKSKREFVFRGYEGVQNSWSGVRCK